MFLEKPKSLDYLSTLKHFGCNCTNNQVIKSQSDGPKIGSKWLIIKKNDNLNSKLGLLRSTYTYLRQKQKRYYLMRCRQTVNFSRN